MSTCIVNQVNQKTPVQHVIVNNDRAGQRIDNFLFTELKGVPKSLIYRILRSGEIRVNKGRIKPFYKLISNDHIRIPPLRLGLAVNKPMDLYASNFDNINNLILYEDDQLLVINKPSGLAVHGGSGISLGLIELLRAQKKLAHENLELVHRLDKNTSGCVLVAKKRSTLRKLHALWREGKVYKQYHALVQGCPASDFVVEAALKKFQLRSMERMVVVDPTEGKYALTKFKILKKFDNCSLVEANPITGRTHQIRVHAAHKKYPIIGDDKYGDKDFNKKIKAIGLNTNGLKINRLLLHAHNIAFDLAESKSKSKLISVTAPLDNKFSSALSVLELHERDEK